ncbi:pancreatic triacylglycerol lipase-like [Chelonus insularis]|uniref:pancreatic triacylglycerol lipase-like n=1 Tax=Chelonus insularis TaxID=460826 RepID=UPI00158D34CC|nr:pancreatic triacylglycerol lipase-like [Chelonus insularis]
MDFKVYQWLSLCFIGIFINVTEGSVCYDELGCFDTEYPWASLFRPFSAPESPQDVNTTFFFSNRIVNKTFIQTWPTIQIHPEFNSQKPTYFITHGYTSESDNPWFNNLTEAILFKKDSNVFAVDWALGSSALYCTAASNTRIVAAEIQRVIHYLKANASLDLSKVHLFGHSLGAHIMAYVGKNFTNPPIHRITALDPAQPGFQGKNALVRLNNSDASFIDVVHTDGKPFLPFLGLGMTSGVGHVDFFVNGGKWQPNCLLDGEAFPYKNFWEIPMITITILYNLATCSHTRAPRYMAAAIKEPCHMWAYRYNATTASFRWSDFIIDDKCDVDSCSMMGLETVHFPARGNFAFETSGIYPFCLNDTETEQKMRKLWKLKNEY